MKSSQFDLVIMGGGLVGAALALALKDADINIAIVDIQNQSQLEVPKHAASNVEDFEPRVSALTQVSVELLSRLGAWEKIQENLVQPYQKMQVWDELGTAEIQFDAAELYRNELGFIVENHSMLSAMYELLESQKNIECFWENGLSSLSKSGEVNELKVGDDIIKASLVVGADGANSRVRQLSGLPTREWDYEHQAIVCTVETENPHEGIARQRFSEAGPLAFLPLKDLEDSGCFCSIVWSLESNEAKRLMSVNDLAFCTELNKAIEGQLGEIKKVSKRFSFPLRQRHAKDYVGQQIALIGDAAHTIHPLAGQGVNLGFKDVDVLSRLIVNATQEELPIGHSSVLKRYQRERQGDNLLMMGAMEGFKQLFGNSNPMLRWARNAGLDFVNRQSLIKNQLAKHAMGL